MSFQPSLTFAGKVGAYSSKARSEFPDYWPSIKTLDLVGKAFQGQTL
jgi:hypothetical protein